MSDEQPHFWWCKTHQREARHFDEKRGWICDPKLGGILMPCDVERRWLDHPFFIDDEPYPHGKIAPDDEGEIKMLIAADHEHNVVRIQFTKKIVWLALDHKSAENFACLILDKVDELKAGKLPEK